MCEFSLPLCFPLGDRRLCVCLWSELFWLNKYYRMTSKCCVCLFRYLPMWRQWAKIKILPNKILLQEILSKKKKNPEDLLFSLPLKTGCFTCWASLKHNTAVKRASIHQRVCVWGSRYKATHRHTPPGRVYEPVRGRKAKLDSFPVRPDGSSCRLLRQWADGGDRCEAAFISGP